MRKLFLLMLVFLPLVAGAQTFSFWSYPRDKKKDAQIEAVVLGALQHGYTKEPIRVPVSYTYTNNDSSFAVVDVQSKIFRVFIPDKGGVKELARTDTVSIYEKPDQKSKVNKSQSVGGDGILPKSHTIPEAPKSIKSAASAVAVVKIAAVEAACRDGKDWTEKSSGKKLTSAEKRKAAWKIETGKIPPDAVTKADKGKAKMK